MADFGDGVIRKLTANDIPYAVQLSTDAGWNQTSEDWCTLLELASEGCMAIEIDGELAATTTLVCHGQRLAWIGMVLTGVRYRGRGLARRLLTQALNVADQTRIETVKLDATAQGRPLYEKLGFRCEQAVQRWWRAVDTQVAGASAVGPQTLSHQWQDEDLRSFGADRRKLLSKLAQRNPPLMLGNSYLFTRPGRLASYLGPCVCQTPESARALIKRALQTHSEGGWYWDLLPGNAEAVALARALNFIPKRYLTRMTRGKELRTNEKMIYAIAGFELG